MGDREKGDRENHPESVMVERAPPTVFDGAKFMQVPIRTADSRATTSMKDFL